MDSHSIRQKFFDFFSSKQHEIVASAPIVLKDDPTLMFTNAGMNQFKDFFLGTAAPSSNRIADTQKCLRVSGKHNDLEEVGRDSYHHTMFEMLGNWSFGDYFKKEAIAWAWELLTKEYGLDPERLYASVFKGDPSQGLSADEEAVHYWKKYLPKERILYFDRKDNFWEMGDTGPCGPCSEIHIDLRSDEERKRVEGSELVNMDDPLVVEVWNLVFIQYNRLASGKLEELPAKHIDTGMGFERLCMALQGKQSNYDTDIFTPFIEKVEKLTGKKYGGVYEEEAKVDIAIRVIVDHLRAVAFAIADGEIPSNTGAGYVIRRILRRAVRYYYSFLQVTEPMIYSLVGLLVARFGDTFPELKAQEDFVTKVIHEEEKSFLKTLAEGIKRIENLEISDNLVKGSTAFELYDTYGFPIDLTRLIAAEKGWTVDEKGFEIALNEQKERSRADAKRETGDWHIVNDESQVQFIGYDQLDVENASVLRYRTVKEKDKEVYQLVLSHTPFYPEGGGQVGDTGVLTIGGEQIVVLSTKKENDLIIHQIDRLPLNLEASVNGCVDGKKRTLTENNHTATHLMHAALRKILGTHVQQRGSLVRSDYLRFDFSHFQKMTKEEIQMVEDLVNHKIRENIALREDRSIPIEMAKEAGAMMLFGEKYGDNVRMITFDPTYSVELCGGCHVSASGEIGLFKIVSESAIAAGVRRIEAVTARGAEEYIKRQLNELNSIRSLFKNPVEVRNQVSQLQEENKALKKEVVALNVLKAQQMKQGLLEGIEVVNGVNIIRQNIGQFDSKAAKTLAYNISQEVENTIILFGLENNGKPQLMLTIPESLSTQYHAGKIVKDLAREIRGGGGGQAFFATAGGSDLSGMENALNKIIDLL